MTVKELCASEGVNLCYFDGSEWHSPGFFNPVLNIFNKEDKAKILEIKNAIEKALINN